MKSKGSCFSCLSPGHLSKFCKKRAECNECTLKHPDILHKDREESAYQEKNSSAQEENPRSQAPVTQEAACVTGAEENECVLSIVPSNVHHRGPEKETERQRETNANTPEHNESRNKPWRAKTKNQQLCNIGSGDMWTGREHVHRVAKGIYPQ